jgi:hypothetical protein
MKANLAILHMSGFFNWSSSAGTFDDFDMVLVKRDAGYRLLLVFADEVLLEGDKAVMRELADGGFADRVATLVGDEMQRRKVKTLEKGGEYVA